MKIRLAAAVAIPVVLAVMSGCGSSVAVAKVFRSASDVASTAQMTHCANPFRGSGASPSPEDPDEETCVEGNVTYYANGSNPGAPGGSAIVLFDLSHIEANTFEIECFDSAWCQKALLVLQAASGPAT